MASAENYLIQGCLIALSGFLAWYGGGWIERFRMRREVRSAAAKAEAAEQYAESARKELAHSRAEAAELQKTLSAERAAQSESLLTLMRGYHRKMFRLAFVCAGAGLLTGSVFAGWMVSVQSEVRAIRMSTDLEIRARVAEARAEGLVLELRGAREEYRLLWKNFMDNLEAKTVTAAKLETLLEQLSTRKIKGALEMDVAALRKNLEDLQKQEPSVMSEWFPGALNKV